MESSPARWMAVLAALLSSACGGGGDTDTGSEAETTAAIQSFKRSCPTTTSAPEKAPSSRHCRRLSGSITGLRTAGLVLRSGSETISPKAYDTSFSFADTNALGPLSGIHIAQQPSWQRCAVHVDRHRHHGYSVTCQMLEARVTTIAGTGVPGSSDGPGDTAQFYGPSGVVVDPQRNLFVSDVHFGSIRKITPDRVVGTFAGRGYPQEIDGTGPTAGFRFPLGIAIASDDTLYVSSGDSNVRRVTPDAVTTTLGSCCYTPIGVAVDRSGNVYAANSHNGAIAVYRPDNTIATYAGLNDPTGSSSGNVDGSLLDARFIHPWGLAFDPAGNLFVADSASHTIRKIAGGMVTTLAGSTQGYVDETGAVARFSGPNGIAADRAGNLYVLESGNFRVRLITPEGTVTTLAGSGVAGSADGIGTSASFSGSGGLTVDAQGNVYVADTGNHKIRKISPE